MALRTRRLPIQEARIRGRFNFRPAQIYNFSRDDAADNAGTAKSSSISLAKKADDVDKVRDALISATSTSRGGLSYLR